jgi:hypothetical protein
MKRKLGVDGSMFQETLEDIYFSGYSVETFYLHSHLAPKEYNLTPQLRNFTKTLIWCS